MTRSSIIIWMYEGKVKCIYIDPPYNTGNEGNEREGRGVWTWWTNSEVGYTQVATQELSAILGKAVFDYPKPVRLISRIIQMASSDGDIILDSFAGSGTTAHAVLNRNKEDKSHRKFILIELGDYADTITAERVKRVIDGYGEGKSAVEGRIWGLKL